MPDPLAPQALVAVEHVSHYYAGRQDVTQTLDNVSLTIGPSEFIAVVGPSGCGKTTLLMLLAGLRFPDKGVVLIDGVPVRKPFGSLGVMFQSDLLLDWRDILGNVMLQADVRRLDARKMQDRARYLLASAGLQGYERRRPRELSGGMRQRVAVCRALLHGPRLLLMDEPFGALDSLTRYKMNLFLQRMWLQERSAVLLITHNVDEAVFLADRVIVMSPGPGRVLDDVCIDLPRPRDTRIRATPRYQEYVARVLRYFEEDRDA